MNWFRSNRGGVAWLAFFALACQLFLTFGHFHPGKTSGSLPVLVGLSGGDASTAVAPSAPPNSPTGLADDLCAICLNISLAGSLVAPSTPIAIAPLSSARQLPWSPAPRELVSADHIHFDARGPPKADIAA
jgi:hypothetical protein